MTQPISTLDADPSSTLPFAGLVPETLLQYRALILAAIDFFINSLPPHRREALDRRWSALPPHAPPEARLLELFHACPTLHKLGQLLARERRLPLELRRQLQRLESMPPWTRQAAVYESLMHELGGSIPPELEIAPSAIAEASVAVVVPFTWRPGADRSGVEGVFKILKPGVCEQIDDELAIWGRLGVFLDSECGRLGAPRLDYRDTFESLTELLRAETRLDVEQAHLRAAAKCFAHLHDVCVPQVLPFCTPRVTAMTRIQGRKVTEASHLSNSARRNVARAIIEGLVVDPILRCDEFASFHADSHAGNLLATDDGRLGILDWSLVGRLSKLDCEQMAQVFLGAFARDPTRIVRAIKALSARPVAESSLWCAVGTALNRLTWPCLPGLRWFLDLLDALVVSAQVRFGPDLVLFRKSLLMLEGVLADLDPEFDADQVMIAAVAGQFAREWPTRMFANPASRAFGTHVSNADLAGACVAVPSMALRSWQDAWFSPFLVARA